MVLLATRRVSALASQAPQTKRCSLRWRGVPTGKWLGLATHNLFDPCWQSIVWLYGDKGPEGAQHWWVTFWLIGEQLEIGRSTYKSVRWHSMPLVFSLVFATRRASRLSESKAALVIIYLLPRVSGY